MFDLQALADDADRATVLDTVVRLLWRDERKLRELVLTLHQPSGVVLNIALCLVANEVTRREVQIHQLPEFPRRVDAGRVHAFLSNWATDEALADAGITGEEVMGAAVAGIRILYARLLTTRGTKP